MPAVDQRRASIEDCQPGAVLFIQGAFWDVAEVMPNGQVRLVGDWGEVRHVSASVLRSYVFVRPAPRFDQLPELDAETETLRRIGVLANLDADAA